jgi:putative FmdB family regulatory protein
VAGEEEAVPTYQYACTACGEQLEIVQKFTDEALTECPACGGRLRKVFSAAGIIFKGSGFYATDSRGSGKSSSSASSSSSSDKSEKSASDKSSAEKSSSSEKKSESASTSTSSEKVA